MAKSSDSYDKDLPLEQIVSGLPVPLRRIAAVFRFEINRTGTPQRVFAWGLIVVFPVAIMGLLSVEADQIDDPAWGLIVYGLVPQIMCMLGLLLWVAPVVNGELEGRTWSYLAVRPGGKIATLIGKYLNGVAWTFSGAVSGLTIGMLVSRPVVLSEPIRFWLVMSTLSLLSCLAYGAVYAALGSLFPRKSMVVTFSYMFVFEVVISNVPAVISQITIHHRLINLLYALMNWKTVLDTTTETSETPPLVHALVLLLYIALMLTAAGCIIRWREYVTSEESH